MPKVQISILELATQAALRLARYAQEACKGVKMIYYTKEELEEMLGASKSDYEKWKETSKLAYLRDASNKLVAIAENLLSNKLDRDMKNYGEFRANFDKLSKDTIMKEYLHSLHVFFYEGLSYDTTTKDIEYIYHKTYKFFRNLVGEEKYNQKRKLIKV